MNEPAEPFNVHTVDNAAIEVQIVESMIVMVLPDGYRAHGGLVFRPDQAEQLGRALWDLGREE